ncbi:hypothetical protein GWR56_12605 [Mucilaginibacter sp. 14171R-50]|uniref:hypothetical protein n=1 Tax=Mucilaginibacter sp. 14171R-50 TaxID=2703789 RepID=UPI00138D813A|nr:hypothetical protein [Mucilaginibacter sp. 14171R-50]QHS56336.1 hypothetical protein GWR56_12605 [Mucilaginibacter sp. 14171R-50]
MFTIKRYAKAVTRRVNNFFSSLVSNFTLFKIDSVYGYQDHPKNVISFCLFGSNANYLNNVDACLASYIQHFDNWVLRVYAAYDIPADILEKIKRYNCELFVMQSGGFDFRHTFWRFLVLDDPNVSRALIRDIDSVASDREKQMTGDWISSGKKMHIIRDHPFHTELIMAGMWALETKNISQNFKSKMLRFTKSNRYAIDQEFLKKIYHKHFPDILVHDVYKRFDQEEPVIIPHNSSGFYVGEISFDHPAKQAYRDQVKALYKIDASL